MRYTKEAFPFQIGLNRMRTRMTDAKIAADIVNEGRQEYLEGLRMAVRRVGVVEGGGDIHAYAVGIMLKNKKDLSSRLRAIQDTNAAFEESRANSGLAALERARLWVRDLVAIGDY